MPKRDKGVQEEAEEAPAPVAESPLKKKRKKLKPLEAADEAPVETNTLPTEERLKAEERLRRKKKKAAKAGGHVNAWDDVVKNASTAVAAADEVAEEAEAEEEAAAPEVASTWNGGEELGRTLYVRGLPWATTEEVLRKDFGECGEITEIHMVKDWNTGLPKGIAFITYQEEKAVQAALKFDGTDYGGRVLEVRREVGKGKGKGKGKDNGKDKGNSSGLEVFIRGLGPKAKESGLQKEFENCGEVERCKMDVDVGDGNRCKGYAWITFTTQGGMDEALKRHGTEYKGHEITVEKSGQHKLGKGAAKGKAVDAGGGIEVFVRGLPPNTDEEVLRKDFLECGEMNKINLPMDHEGNCKGYAWIFFKTQEGADSALTFNGDDYGGSKLLVEIAGQHKKGDSKGKGKGKSGPGPKPVGCTSVVVKKLSYEATEADLTKTFSKCGGSGPIDVKILTDWNTGKSKGIAFVDFGSEKAVDDAIKLSGGVIKGLTFFLDYAAPRAPLM